MNKSVFSVVADGFKFNVVADSKREAIEHCFKCFDYDSIKVQYTTSILSSIEYPHFMEEYNYAV